MVLLPKMSSASSIGHYRPIVLSNFLFKVISKILTNRLAHIFSCVVSQQQFGFIQGRSVQYCIAETSECLNMLNSRLRLNNFFMKIDIRKAFDTMRWDFLLSVLQGFGSPSDRSVYFLMVLINPKIPVT